MTEGEETGISLGHHPDPRIVANRTSFPCEITVQ